ncbi:MAG TPA: ATP-binding protein, partial [Propionibacteriaceae bacterium]
VTEDVVRTLLRGEPVHQFNVRLLKADGSAVAFAWSAVPDTDPDSGIFYTVGRDITEQQNREEMLRQSQKMEAVGQLTGGLAHDFNNLLTGMMGNLELLQMRLARGRVDDLGRFITAAQGAGRRAASLTQRLLAFSRRQTLDPKPTDVHRLIAGMTELLQRTVGPETVIEVVDTPDLWPAMIDGAQLESALLNLSINARDAMLGGGKITIEAANKQLDTRSAAQHDMNPGEYLSICVTDTGTGMESQVIERAFEPFFTTKPIGQGTGLGLSMVYGFARQSGGQVRIYSEVGLGTTICIYLPRHEGEAWDEVAEDATPQEIVGGNETVLVVDDEATIRHLIDEVLDEQGYTVIGAADGAAGIKVLQSGARIDLLITDVGLPNGLNGRQVADAARALRPGLRVLFITGYAENAAVGNGHLEPGMELLTKPFTIQALSLKVRDILKPMRR